MMKKIMPIFKTILFSKKYSQKKPTSTIYKFKRNQFPLLFPFSFYRYAFTHQYVWSLQLQLASNNLTIKKN